MYQKNTVFREKVAKMFGILKNKKAAERVGVRRLRKAEGYLINRKNRF
jgi:hypothetical protein